MSNTLHSALFEQIQDTPNMMVGLNKNADHNEPMHVCLEDDNYDAFWIFTTKDNRIAGGGKAMAQFVSGDHKLFGSFSGYLVVETDKTTIQDHFSTSISAWYKDGMLDDNMQVLRFDVESVEIWEKDPSMAAKLKMAIGAKVSEDELGRHALV
ncbi:pyridoxamine 5'-phosphate oxidase family protein [Glaciecola siphonariae]|uniref:Pyridoxamine 5'-phosphate oxidase family protein n=1 Tax=Glaciecola siphonariae TaxID=521012 RepID=A0ABV9LXW4_9ALTE